MRQCVYVCVIVGETEQKNETNQARRNTDHIERPHGQHGTEDLRATALLHTTKHTHSHTRTHTWIACPRRALGHHVAHRVIDEHALDGVRRAVAPEDRLYKVGR